MIRELPVMLVKTYDDTHDGERQFHGYEFRWLSGEPVCVAIDKFCQFGVRFLVGKKRQEQDKLKITLLSVPIADPNQVYLKGRFRRFTIRHDGVLCLIDGSPTVVSFNQNDDARVLEWLGWKGGDYMVDIGVKYDE